MNVTLPFAIPGCDFDNGSEWLNWTLIPQYTEARGPLHNFFQPSMKLVAKWRAGSRWACRRALQS
jgi:hypothetical protein